MRRLILVGGLGWVCCGTPVLAQRVPFAGVIAGVADISADASSVNTSQGPNISLYKPENGPALNLFAGMHLAPYLSVQANYIWNRNELTLNSSSPDSKSYFEEQRSSSQQALIFDLLVYVRSLNSRIRPYLSFGTGPVRFSSTQEKVTAIEGTPALPPEHFSSVRLAFRSAVGMDFQLTPRTALRYSFSETIRHNDISAQLSPPGQRSLANYQNLIGVVIRF